MALILHCAGTATIHTGTGAAFALEELGVSVDGVKISLNTMYDEVFTDHYGPKIPYDRQYFLTDADIEMDLIWYDIAVLKKIISGIQGPAAGQMYPAGTLVLQQQNAFRLLIKSTPTGVGLTAVEDCWNFPQCILVDPDRFNLGVEKTVHALKFKAMLNQQASSSAGAVLYNFLST